MQTVNFDYIPENNSFQEYFNIEQETTQQFQQVPNDSQELQMYKKMCKDLQMKIQQITQKIQTCKQEDRADFTVCQQIFPELTDETLSGQICNEPLDCIEHFENSYEDLKLIQQQSSTQTPAVHSYQKFEFNSTQESNETKILNQKQPKLLKKKISKAGMQTQNNSKKVTSYSKNICRYLTRKTIRCFGSEEYKKVVKSFCQNNQRVYKGAVSYFLENIEKVSGFKAVKEYFDLESESDSSVREYKMLFKKFYVWFLKNRIVRYIMTGDMEHKDVYIKYKNQVMLKYIDNLQSWQQQEPEKFKNEIKQSESQIQLNFNQFQPFKIVKQEW